MRLRLALSVGLVAASAALVPACGKTSGPAPLVTGQQGVDSIASDDFFVYWTVNTGALRRVSVDGGKVETLATGAPGPSSIALDATYVYWAAGDGTVSRVSKKGGSPTVLAQPGKVLSLAVDDSNVYFSDGDRVLSVSKDQSATSANILASGETNARNLQVSTSIGKLFWADDGGPLGIREEAVQGGMPVALLPESTPHSLALAPTHVVWNEVATGAISAATYDGGEVLNLGTVDPTEGLEAIVADEQNAYISTDAGVVRAVPLNDGATPEVVVSGPQGAVKLAIDANNVYTANPTDGTVFVIAK